MQWHPIRQILTRFEADHANAPPNVPNMAIAVGSWARNFYKFLLHLQVELDRNESVGKCCQMTYFWGSDYKDTCEGANTKLKARCFPQMLANHWMQSRTGSGSGCSLVRQLGLHQQIPSQPALSVGMLSKSAWGTSEVSWGSWCEMIWYDMMWFWWSSEVGFRNGGSWVV